MLKKLSAFLMAVIIAVVSITIAGINYDSEVVYANTYDALFVSGVNAEINKTDNIATINNLSPDTPAEIIVNAPVSGEYDVNLLYSTKYSGEVEIFSDTDYCKIKCGADLSKTTGNLLLKMGENKITVKSDVVMSIKQISISSVSSLYEAEAGDRSGYALIAEDDAFSGGAKVTQIGGPNTDVGSVTFSVYAPKSGSYGMTLAYTAQSSEYFYVEVNKDERIKVSLSSQSDNNSPISGNGVQYIETNLSEGYNRVKIFSDKEKVMDLDCINVFSPREKIENLFEDSEAKLLGSANQRRIFKAQDGNGITGLGPDGSAEFTVNVGSGKFELAVWYSSPEYRALEVYVDSKLADTIYCPITAEDYNIETVTTTLKLSSGTHVIKLTNKYSEAPDIDKICLSKTSQKDFGIKTKGERTFENSTVSVKYNMSTGKADFYSDGQERVKNIESVVKLESDSGLNSVVKSSDYSIRRVESTALNDGFGLGTAYTVISNGVGKPEMRQTFYVYETKPYIMVAVSINASYGLKTNFMAPITALGDNVVNIGNITDGRSLYVPYDNDNWVRYSGNAFGGLSKSYWVTSIYDNNSRKAVVTGSVDHDTWKTGATSYTKSDGVNFLGAFAGAWSSQDTYDYQPHGSLDGNKIESPKMFLGYFDDWRDGMETYGDANNCNVPRLEWNDAGVPFGYNSWYGQGSKVNYNESCEVSDFVNELQNNGFSDDDGVAYVNLDSYWDSFSDEQLKEFVEKCHANNQKAGIYWSHFVFWATDMSWKMGVPGTDYLYRDAALNDSDGGVVAIGKGSDSLPLDPTSDAMKARLNYFMTKFVDLGFEYLKIDFLNYAAIEGVHADPNVKTGMQAYNQAVKMFTDYVDTSKFFLSYSIAPLFPYQYAHARRISCDTATNIGEVAYMMNSLNYGWWEDNTLYEYVDPDHISFSSSATEAKTRYNSAVVTGTLMLLSDSYKNNAMKDLTRQIVSNKELLNLAKLGRAFRPIDGNTDQWATDAYTLDTENSFYIALFNFETNSNKTISVNLARAGLESGKDYTAVDLWTGEKFNIKDNFSMEFLPASSTILRIDK